MAIKLDAIKDRGAEAIAAASKGSGKFQAFTPTIKWDDDGEEKYVLFLIPIEDTPRLRVHEWIDCGEKKIGDKTFTDWGFFLDRTDPVLDEDDDPLTAKGSTPRQKLFNVAVELEPIMGEGAKGRARPKGFAVKTETFTRKTDDGDEEVTAPVVGVVSQAGKNFFNLLTSHDESDGDITEYAFRVKRIGKKKDVTYSFTPFLDQDIDLTELVENVEGISYLSRDEEAWGELEPILAETENDEEAARVIAVALLEKRINELADWDLYKEKTDHIEEIEDRFGGGSEKKKRERPARQSSRKSRDDDESGDDESKQDKRKARFDEIKRLAAERAEGSSSDDE